MVITALQETVTLPLLSEWELLAVISGIIDNTTAWPVEALPNEKPVVVATAFVTLLPYAYTHISVYGMD